MEGARVEKDSSESGGQTPGPRRGAATFVALFVALVLIQLTAYRYAVDTRANDFYLLTVARHTAWVLERVGHSATVEQASGSVSPGEVRAYLDSQGGSPNPEANFDQETPLSAWERWRYRALRLRENPAASNEIGPRVSFVLRAGIHHEIQAVEAAREQVAGENAAAIEERQRLDIELQSLRQTLTNSLGDPEVRKQLQGTHFTFNVVPTCGAVEIMAIFLAAVLAYPAPWRTRLMGLLAGLPVLYAINIGRLFCLAVIGALDGGGPWFTFVHEYIWQAVYVVFVVMVWLIWVECWVRRTSQ